MKRILLALLLFASAALANDSLHRTEILHSVELKGNTAFPCSNFQHIFDPYLGKKLSPKDEVEIAEKINSYYQSRGYTFSFVHEVRYKNSKLYIEILEGSVRNIVCDDNLKNNKLLQKYIKIIQSTKPFNDKELERTIVLIGQIPGIKGKQIELVVDEIYKPEDININKPEIIDLILLPSSYDRAQAYFSFDNRHSLKSEYTLLNERARRYLLGEASATINNPFNCGDALTLSIDSSWDKLHNEAALSYAIPINALGTTLRTTAAYMVSKQLVEDKIGSASVGVTHPLFLTRDHGFDIGARFSFASIKEKGTVTSNASLSKAIINCLYKAQAYGEHFYLLGFHQNVGSKVGAVKRNFHKLVFNGTFISPAYKDVLTFRADVNGQYTGSYLPKHEYFAAGESRGGRGFMYSEIFGTKGVSVSSEVAFSKYTKDFIVSRYKYYVYLDSSWVSRTEKKQRPDHILSYGIGTDLVLANNAVLTLELSKPHKNTSKATSKTSLSPIFFVGFKYYFRY